MRYAGFFFTLWKRLIIFLSAVFLSSVAQATELVERVGTLELSELFLEPTLHYVESRTGSFEPGNSLIAVRWIRDEMISATVMVGTADLLNRPKRYVESSEEGVILAEAYVEARSYLGRFRFGRIPLPFGTESGRGEARQRFPRSFVFRDRWVGLRDQGLSYHVDNAGFFSEWALHNGEGGADKDNQIWFTGRWGWRGGDGVYLGFSGSVGRTTPGSTQDVDTVNPRGYADAGLDPDASAKIRIGNAFVEWDARPLGATFEVTAAETLQSGQTSRLRAGHFDLSYALGSHVGLLARYEIIDPDQRRHDDRREASTLGFSLRGSYETSVFYVFGTRVHDQGQTRASHEAMVVWKVTPLAHGPR